MMHATIQAPPVVVPSIRRPTPPARGPEPKPSPEQSPPAPSIWSQFRPAAVILLLLTLVTGIAYPALVTVVAQAAFRHQANGSVIVRDGKPVGSELIGQTFGGARYFWSRPSAAGSGYDATAGSGTNLAPSNPKLHDGVRERVAALRALDAGNTAPVPVDLVTSSASGLDPHVSPAAAYYQVARAARARGMPVERVRALVDRYTEGRTLGVLGEPRVNVLELNLALDNPQAVVPEAAPVASDAAAAAQPHRSEELHLFRWRGMMREN